MAHNHRVRAGKKDAEALFGPAALDNRSGQEPESQEMTINKLDGARSGQVTSM
jgi:hypothetical protein